MFRQKIIQVTDCSCRLIPDSKNDYKLFKTQQTLSKPQSKQIKEKYSLKIKTLTTSSQKQNNNKINSANKITENHQKNNQLSKQQLKTQKNEDEKISISGNLDSRKKKTNQKISVCSPSQSNIRKIDCNNLQTSNVTEITIQTNCAKTAQAQRNNKQKRMVRNSHHQLPLQAYMARQQKTIKVSNFMNQSSSNYTSQPSEQPTKKFQQYYKLISNPYMIKNKQNITNMKQPYHCSSKQDVTINSTIKRVQKGVNNDRINMNEKISNKCNRKWMGNGYGENQGIQLFHESLEKYQKGKNKEREGRGTFNQYKSNQNCMNLQNDFKICQSIDLQTNQSLMNLKNHNNPLNQSYINQKICQLPSSLSQIDLNKNKSEIYVQKQGQISQNNHKNLQNFVNFKTQKSLQQENQDEDNSSSEQELKAWVNNVTDFFNSKGYTNKVQNPNSLAHRPVTHIVHDKNIKSQKVLIEKINSFNEIMSSRQQCESVLDQSNDTDQSIVVMRYRDFLQKTDRTNNNSEEQTSILKPLNINTLHNTKPKISSLTVSTKPDIKYQTNVKKHNKKQSNYLTTNNQNDYMMRCSNNLKKTVKISKEYLTKNFNLMG